MPRYQIDVASVPRGPGASGDLVCCTEPTPGLLRLVVGDVTGHGPEAARHAAYIEDVVRRTEPVPPASAAAALGQVAEALWPYLQTHRVFASLVVLTLDLAAGSGELASAGHPPPWLVDEVDGSAQPLEARGLLLGLAPRWRYAALAFPLPRRCLLLAYTDGLIDCLPREERAGALLLLAAAARRLRPVSAHRLLDVLKAEFSLAAFADDTTLVAARFDLEAAP